MDSLERIILLADDLERYRREVLIGIDKLIRKRWSRRQFFTQVLDAGVITHATWGRWVNGEDVPNPKNWKRLLPYLQRHLELNSLDLEDPPDTDSFPSQDRNGASEYWIGVSDEELAAGTDAAILLAHQAENSADPVEVAQRRPRAILLLTGLAPLIEDKRIERRLYGAEAAITLALLLPEVGRHEKAEEFALGATYCLETLFEEVKSAQTRVSLSHPGITYLELAILGYLRAGVGARNSRMVPRAHRHYQNGIRLANRSTDSRRWRATIDRDIAKALVIRPSQSKEAANAARSSLDEFERMRHSDDLIQCYATLEVMARVKVVQRQFRDALTFTNEGRGLESSAHPGPIHRALLLRTEARAKHGDGDSEGWLESLSEAVSLCDRAGLQFELTKIRRSLQKMHPEDLDAARPLLDRLNRISQKF